MVKNKVYEFVVCNSIHLKNLKTLIRDLYFFSPKSKFSESLIFEGGSMKPVLFVDTPKNLVEKSKSCDFSDLEVREEFDRYISRKVTINVCFNDLVENDADALNSFVCEFINKFFNEDSKECTMVNFRRPVALLNKMNTGDVKEPIVIDIKEPSNKVPFSKSNIFGNK